MNHEQTLSKKKHRVTWRHVGVLAITFLAVFAVLNFRSVWTPLDVEGPLAVKMTGCEFHWRFSFPGPDGKFNTEDDAQVSDEIHLPSDREVQFLVTSDDYVYTMSVPKLNLRHAAIPELTFTISFTPSDAGTFAIVADPLCSVRLWHDEDMGSVVVEPDSEFESWYNLL